MAAERMQERRPPIEDGTSRVCYLWRLPIEILDMIFELSFVNDRSLDDLKYANRRKLRLSKSLGLPPEKKQKVRKLPTQLAVSRDWYTLALRSWLRLGTLLVSPSTLRNLRDSPSALRSSITSVKLRIDKYDLDIYARQQHHYVQMGNSFERRSMARKLIQEVLDLCPNLQRLKLTRMDFTDLIALEVLRPYYSGPVVDAWLPIAFDEAWANIFVRHHTLQHLAISIKSSRGGFRACEDGQYVLWANNYLNIRLKCRGIPLDDYRAVAEAIGYDESAKLVYTGGEATSRMPDSLSICSLMYAPDDRGRKFFDEAFDEVAVRAFG